MKFKSISPQYFIWNACGTDHDCRCAWRGQHRAGLMSMGPVAYIDPGQWNPLIYNFRHYSGSGRELRKTFKAEV